MPTINELTSVDSVNADDKVPLYSTTNGDARKASMTALAEFFQQQINGAAFMTQRAAPATTGFSVTVAPAILGDNVWLLLKGAAPFANGTIKLPPASEAIDKQTVQVSSTNPVVSLTTSSSGATVLGAPTTILANSFFTLRYDLIDTTWYRVA